MIDGADDRAFMKTSLIIFSESPTHLQKISGPLTAIKLRPDSDAKAIAKRVLLHPGGPYKRIPL